MRKYSKKILIAVGCAAIAVTVLILFPSSNTEPTYDGHSPSYWVENCRGIGKPQEKASEANSHIGTNAIPYLIKWIQYEEPTWKRRWHEFAERRFGKRILPSPTPAAAAGRTLMPALKAQVPRRSCLGPRHR
jgi:hypothetical protein